MGRLMLIPHLHKALDVSSHLKMTHSEIYIEKLKSKVSSKISSEINESNLEDVIADLNFHLLNKTSSKFQAYYFRTLSNEQHYFAVTDFFREFKSRYSLQAIDTVFLDNLEERKEQIIDFVRNDNLVDLYFTIFNKAKVKHKDETKEKDLASFFAKFVHTFKPEKYCALDNLVKNYLGLSKEGFFISFIVISEVYKQWATEHSELVGLLRERFSELDTSKRFRHESISDLKLLDLIFWRKADKQKKEKDRLKKQRKAAANSGLASVGPDE